MWSKVLLLVGVWLVPGAVICVQELTYARAYAPEGVSLAHVLVHFLPVWLPWAGFTPLIFALQKRIPLAWRSTPQHLLACAAFGSAHILLLGLARTTFPPAAWSQPDLGAWLQRTLWSAQTQAEVIAYFCVVLAATSEAARSRSRREGRRSLELKAELAHARLASLRSQLQPHFLFNTLNAIDVLMVDEPKNAALMLHRLSALLRRSLDCDVQLHSLDEELQHLGCYLDIERVRFSDRLAVQFDIEPSARRVPVPTLLLQPLVENAIRHGIAPLAKGGLVEVSAKHRAGRLCIVVQDDGAGLGGFEGDGIGLANTKARLTQLFGEDHAFEIQARKSGGTRVTLELPA